MASDKKWTIWTIFQGQDKLSGTIATVTTKVNKLSATAAGMSKSMLGGMNMLHTAANLFVGGVVAKKVLEFASTGDEIAKTARMLGVSAQALQELRFAADREGVSVEDLNTGIRMMNNNLGQFKAHQGSMYTYLTRTNPALAQQALHAKTSEEAFNIFADALGKTTNAADKAALAQAIFGRSGQQLIKMTGEGSAGIAALREEARKLGGIMSDDAAASSEKFKDSLTDATAAGKGFLYGVLGPFLSIITPIIKGLTDLIVNHKELVFILIGSIGAYFAVAKGLAIYAGIMKIVAMRAKAWAVIQAILNAVMSANPIALIVIGIMILIGVIILIVKNWDKVVAAFKTAFQWIKDHFAQGIRAALVIAFWPIFAAYGVIKGIITLIKGGSLKDALGALNPMGFIKTGKLDGGGGGDQTRMSSNPASSTSSTTKSVVDVNLNNVPKGSTVKQQGNAPGFTLGMGYQGAH